MIYKKCFRCKENKLATMFTKTKDTKDGLYSMCKKCRSERAKYLANRVVTTIVDLPYEIWKHIEFIPYGYMVSNLGRVKSLRRSYRKIDQLIKITTGKRGYPVCKIGNKIYYLHRLIAISFIPNSLNLPQINHIDGNKLNYSLNNLEWVTNKENNAHAHKLGLLKTARGEQAGLAKLTEKQVIFILKNPNKSPIKLAKKYNVSRGLIQKIKRGDVWKHLYSTFKSKTF